MLGLTSKESMTSLPIILILFIAMACGKPDASKKIEGEEILMIDGSNIQGVFQTPLNAMNMNTTLGTIGSAGVYRSYDSFQAFVKVYIAQRDVIHRQSIHLGARCPSVDDDINGDGYIDLREAYFVVGNMIIPLDGDLNSQFGGSGYYPMGNGIAGGYFYESTASFFRLFTDLRDVDPNSLDTMEKIPYERGLSLHKKVILILGVGTSTRLPDSIDTMNGLNSHASLPIACGVLKRSERFPTELYDRTDPMTSPNPFPPPNIRPRTLGHREPDVIIPLPNDPSPPRRPPLRQRLRRWIRSTLGNEDNHSRVKSETKDMLNVIEEDLWPNH